MKYTFDFVYRLTAISKELECKIDLELTEEEFFAHKWIKATNKLVLNDLYYNYDKLKTCLKSIKRKSEYVYFDSIGWNFFNNKYYYVCSNCTINEEGINHKYKAFKPGFNFNFDDEVGESTAFNDFADVIIEYPYELFPILAFPILSLLITPLAKIGLSPNITLFIKGNMGSGKTELATIFGSFFNRTEDYNKNALSNNICAAMNKFKTFENAFANHRDCTFILDDVHKPKSPSQYKNVQTNINHITRSIYSSSKLNEKQSNCLCIMTGELLEELKSTISRMIVINIDDFINNKKNSEFLSKYQNNNMFISNFFRYFIKWLAKSINDSDFLDKLKNHYLGFRKELFKKYDARLTDSLSFLNLTINLFDFYNTENSGLMDESKMNKLCEYSKKAINKIGLFMNYILKDRIDLFVELLYQAIKDESLKIKYSVSRFEYNENDSISMSEPYENETRKITDNIHFNEEDFRLSVVDYAIDIEHNFCGVYYENISDALGKNFSFLDVPTLIISIDYLLNVVNNYLSKFGNKLNHYVSLFPKGNTLKMLAKENIIKKNRRSKNRNSKNLSDDSNYRDDWFNYSVSCPTKPNNFSPNFHTQYYDSVAYYCNWDYENCIIFNLSSEKMAIIAQYLKKTK